MPASSIIMSLVSVMASLTPLRRCVVVVSGYQPRLSSTWRSSYSCCSGMRGLAFQRGSGMHGKQRHAMASSTSTETDTTDATASTSTSSSSSSFDPSYDLSNMKQGIVGKYNPALFEAEIYKWWEHSGCFTPDAKPSADSTKKQPYVLPMPPPNVTGRLHMGHAIFVALQDILARFYRMRGHPVLWLPGTDHAGIATQLQVEKLLQKEGTSRQQVGRDTFLSRVWQYKEEQGGHITRQLRRLGASADWSRERFTMDQDLSMGVAEAFVRLHEKGLVYRGEYMVNWAPRLQTAVSDLEVEYTEEEGRLYYFKYYIASDDNHDTHDNTQEYLPVATTRPETILGDTAVCVHPQDPRYQHLIGKRALVPMSSSKRTIPIIADDYVDMEFGTGALKITPGHDVNDYTLGKKYNLPIINIMNKDGTLNSNAGAYAGMDRFAARAQLWSDMQTANYVLKDEPHLQRVPRSQRGGEVIEPLVSRQWFVKTKNMGRAALQAVAEKDITIVPERFEKVWYNWLEDVHDWCVSRQLWWGHRIPVWYIVHSNPDNEGETETSQEEEFVVARNEEEARTKATALGHPPDVTLRQEEDVLDTWFSSGLWPFATVGWPHVNNNPTDHPNSDLARFYPASCLETGYDILFFWVARMVMLGIELTGKAPFRVIYLHGLVRAADGSKMSKTKGNVVDPLDAVATYGADSLRYSLVTGVTPGQDVPLNMEKMEANRNFANKLWNCAKFVTENAKKGASTEEWASLAVHGPMPKDEFDGLSLPEQYIVSKCHALVEQVTKDIEGYQLGAAGSKVYDFLWDEYADWYIEISKTRLYEGAGGGGVEEAHKARRVLVYVLDTCLRLLHPYMPFVTEQLWHHLPRAAKKEGGGEEAAASAHSLMVADWPQMSSEPLVQSTHAVEEFTALQALTRSIRNARAEYNVPPGKKIPTTLVAKAPLKDALQTELKSLVSLAKLDPEAVQVYDAGSAEAEEALRETESAKSSMIKLVVQESLLALLPLSGMIDKEMEHRRLTKQAEKLEKEIQKLAGRLESKGFVEKAPEAVVEKVRKELKDLESQAGEVQRSMEALESIA